MFNSGYNCFDKIIEECDADDIVILGSTDRKIEIDLLANIARNITLNCNKPVAVFNWFSSNEKVVSDIITLDSCVNLEKSSFTTEEWKKIKSSMNSLKNAPIFMEDSFKFVTLEEFKEQCRKLKSTCNIDTILIDSIQMIRLDDLYENEADSKEKVIRELKCLARELKIRIICFLDLSANIQKRLDKRPMLTDFMEGIEDYAKAIITLYKDEEDENKIYIRNVVNPEQAKNEFSLAYISKLHKFANFEKTPDTTPNN